MKNQGFSNLGSFLVKYSLSVVLGLSSFSVLFLFFGSNYIWKTILMKHAVELQSLPPLTQLTLGIQFIMTGLFALASMSKSTRKLSLIFAFLMAVVFFSENTFFMHYGSYMKGGILKQAIYSPGEFFWLMKEGTGFEQLVFFFKMFLIIGFYFFFLYILYYKEVIFRALFPQSDYFWKKLLIAVLLVMFGMLGVIFYTPEKENDTKAMVRNLGTLEAHIYYSVFHPEESLAGKQKEDTTVLPEVYIDPTEIPFQNANLILIIMDSVRFDHLPHYGYSRNTMPFLYSLQDDLVKIDLCYAQANGTSLSFPSMLMGTYPYIRKNVPKWGLFAYLNQYGYKASVFSSMDLRWGTGWATQILSYFKEDSVVKIFHASEIPESYRQHGFSKTKYNYGVDDGFTSEQFKNWLTTAPSLFFSIVHFHSSHYSYEVPEKFTVFQPVPKLPFRSAPPWAPMLNAYDNAIFRVDDAIKEVFSSLRESGKLEDSIIAITADHGESFDEHPGSYYHMTSVYESQVRVPFLIYFGKNKSAGKKLVERGKSRLTGLIDVMPTLFRSAGIKLPPQFQGVPVWGKSKKSFEKMISYHFRPKFAARSGKWKYIDEIDVRKKHLYNLEEDPGEKTNLFKKFPEIVSAFKKLQDPEDKTGLMLKKPAQKEKDELKEKNDSKVGK